MKIGIRQFTLGLLAAGALFSSQAFAQGFQLPKMIVTSDAFESGGIIPVKYTSHGENVQPGFTITGTPENAETYAIIFHDIEVAIGGNTDDVLHWTAWNIPADGEIPEGMLPEGSVQGANIRRQNNYMGPGAPYPDRYHHYVFEFYALDTELDLEPSASRADLLAAMQGHVVAKAAYVGRYANAQQQ